MAPFYEQAVTWRDCGDGFECTSVWVPLDHAAPDEERLSLDLVRLPAPDPVGSLLLNPDGPGESGVAHARAAGAELPPGLLERFDIVGFDPRGVAGSEPVDCVDGPQLDALLAADRTPDDLDEIDVLTALSTDLAIGCESRSPRVGAHMDTGAVARDMDVVRAVLGQEKVNLLGRGYGTLLGARYADLFPERVGRMVLAGAVPHSLGADEIALGRARASDATLRRFVADCLPRVDCPLATDVDAGVARIQQFLAGLDAAPLPAADGRVLTEGLATRAILSGLHQPTSGWPRLRSALGPALGGDGTPLVELSDLQERRGPEGDFADNHEEAYLAVSCADRPAEGGSDYAQIQAEIAEREAPVFGPYLAWGNLPCWQWPLAPADRSVDDPPPLRAEGSAPILVVSSTQDPAIPYEWGVRVVDELDDARLLTNEGDPASADPPGSPCVAEAVEAYLLRGVLPGEGAVCPAA